MPGNSPASASAEQEADDRKLFGPTTKAVAPETSPQVIMMRAIHSRAPTLSRTTLLGTSKRQ